jgi:hypothetical protein
MESRSGEHLWTGTERVAQLHGFAHALDSLAAALPDEARFADDGPRLRSTASEARRLAAEGWTDDELRALWQVPPVVTMINPKAEDAGALPDPWWDRLGPLQEAVDEAAFALRSIGELR